MTGPVCRALGGLSDHANRNSPPEAIGRAVAASSVVRLGDIAGNASGLLRCLPCALRGISKNGRFSARCN
jgi:hypothetical protein